MEKNEGESTLSVYKWFNFARLPIWQITVVVSILLGIYIGYKYEHNKFVAYKQEVLIAGEVAKRLTAEKEKKQEEITNEVSKGYADAVKRLNAFYAAKRLHNNSSSRGVSKIPQTSSGTNATTESNLPDTTVEDCAADVLQLMYLQEWVKQQSE